MDDAQFGIIKILRPYTAYTTDYQGQSVLIPIMFTESGLPLDAAAGTPGYSPSLLRGLSVPLGARLTLWLPTLVGVVSPDSIWLYKWSVTWRLRNVFDYRSQRKAYHYPKQSAGVPDTNFPPPKDARVVIPAGVNSVLYAQPRPEQFAATNNFGPTATDQADLIQVDLTNIPQSPLIPGGAQGFFQQGITDPATSTQTPTFITHELQAEGDELLIGVTRDVAANYGTVASATTWNFSANHADFDFATFLAGSPDIGIYVTSGAAS